MRRRQRARLLRWALLALSAALVVAVLLGVDLDRLQHAFFQPDIAASMFPRVLAVAARNTVILTVLGFTGGLIIGLLVALLRLSSVAPYRWFATTYIEIFRGLPALLTIILIGYGLPIALGVSIPKTFGVTIGRVTYPGDYLPGATALAIVAGAYLAETIRAGIQAVPRAQMEAARSLGMTHVRAMRSIVLPQAFRIIVPPLTNEAVLLLKDSALIFVLGTTPQTQELVRFANARMGETFNATPLTVVGLVYLAITIPLTRLAARLERRTEAAR